jgi:hypothetical protein
MTTQSHREFEASNFFSGDGQDVQVSRLHGCKRATEAYFTEFTKVNEVIKMSRQQSSKEKDVLQKKKPGLSPVSRIQAYDYYYACSAVSTTSSAITGRSTNETMAICALSPVRTPHLRIRR